MSCICFGGKKGSDADGIGDDAAYRITRKITPSTSFRADYPQSKGDTNSKSGGVRNVDAPFGVCTLPFVSRNQSSSKQLQES